MYIIAGLGNPGLKYEHTRHNCGFEAIDILAERYRIEVGTKKFKGLCGNGMIEGERVMLVKPMTYMNLSGECIFTACAFYRIDPTKNLIILCDDVSLQPGQIRVRQKGSAGGHNGLKSIINRLGTQDFKRVKIGVGEKPEGWDLADYVLRRFSVSEQVTMNEAFEKAAGAAADLTQMSVERVMNLYN